MDRRVTEADGDVALQTDHRDTATIDAEWEISAIFAAARARSVLLSNRVPAVRFVLPGPVPARYEALVRQLGAAIQTGASGPAVPAAPNLEAARETLEAAVLALGRRALAAHGAKPNIEGVRVVERAIQPPGTPLRIEAEEPTRFWADVVTLGAAIAATLQEQHGGQLVITEEWAGVFPLRWAIGDSEYNVFGRPEEFLERDPTFLPSDQVKLASAPPDVPTHVFFGFRPADWHGADVARCRPLYPLGDRSPSDVPLVALLEDHPETTTTIPRDTPPAEVNDLEAEAWANLAQLVVKQETVDFGGAPLLVVQGHEYAAEKLLDPAFMAQATRDLGGGPLLAAVPRRGLLLLRPAAGEGLPGYLGLVARSHADAPHQARLSASVFRVEGGVVTGPFTPPPPPPRSLWARLFGA